MEFLSTFLPMIGSAIGGLFNARREDTAIQRRVADARAAGIDPATALGAAGAAGSSANPFGDAAASYQASADREEARRAAMAAEELNRRQIESQIELNKKTGDAMILEARSRSVADAINGATRGPGRTLTVPIAGDLTTSPTAPAQRVQDEYGDPVEWVYGIGRLAYDTFRKGGFGDQKMVNDPYKGMVIAPTNEEGYRDMGPAVY